MGNRNWETVFELLTDGDTGVVGCRIIGERALNPAMVAAMMTALLDAVINKIDDQDQIEWERSVIDYFNKMVDFRYAHSYKEMFEPSE